jgi:hypothetical protein
LLILVETFVVDDEILHECGLRVCFTWEVLLAPLVPEVYFAEMVLALVPSISARLWLAGKPSRGNLVAVVSVALVV